MVGKKTMKKIISILILFSASTSNLQAQEIQDLPERRNVIKVASHHTGCTAML